MLGLTYLSQNGPAGREARAARAAPIHRLIFQHEASCTLTGHDNSLRHSDRIAHCGFTLYSTPTLSFAGRAKHQKFTHRRQVREKIKWPRNIP